MKKQLRFLMLTLLCAVFSTVWGESKTVTMTSFSSISGAVADDPNVSYEALQGTAGTAPVVNSNQIRVYQNGGIFKVTANNGAKIQSVTLGSAMNTSVSYKIDGGEESSNQSINAKGKFTLSNQNCTEVLFTCKGTTSSTRLYVNYLSVTYVTQSSSSAVETTTNITAPSSFNTDLAEGTAAGQLSAAVTANGSAIAGAAVTWSSTNTNVATVDNNGNVTLVAVGSADIKASYAGVTDQYAASEATYTVNVTNSNQPAASEVTFDFSVDKASGNNPSITKDGVTMSASNGNFNSYAQYRVYGNSTLTFSASVNIVKIEFVNVTENNLSNGNGYNASTHTWTGSETTVSFNVAKQFRFVKAIVTLGEKPKAKPNLAFAEAEYVAYFGQAFTSPVATSAEGFDGQIQYASSDATVATIDQTTGAVTILGRGETTITASSEATDAFEAGTASYKLTVDNMDPQFSFGSTEYTTVIGDVFEAPSLTFVEGFQETVSYSSSNTDVATVDNNGAVTIVGAGNTTISATSVGTDTYKAGHASYTLTVEKKDAALAFSEASATATIGETFTAPTLTTADDFNGTVNYTSSNENVATVDNTGAVTLLANGLVTITAASAETDLFKAGNASYTLNVVDPNATEATYVFTQSANNYGSGAEVVSGSGNIWTDAKTWTSGQVTLVTSGRHVWHAPSAGSEPTEIRFYKKLAETDYAKMVFSVPTGYTITKIVLTGYSNNSWTVDGTFSNNTWEGNAETVTFVNESENTIEVKTATVTFTKTTTPQPDAPVIWMTYSSNNCLDFTNATDYTAFVATNYKSEEKKVVLTKIKQVPAGVGIVIRSNDPTVGISSIFSEDDVLAEETYPEYAGVNMLVGMPNGGAVSPEGFMAYDNETPAYHFVLAKRDGVVGFYKLTAGNLRANRAYLQIPKTAIDTESSANGISFAVEGEETAIQSVTTATTTDDAWYTLQGVRVAQPTRGLYIHNGKKVVVK